MFALHRAQVRALAFENFDPLLDRRFAIDLESLQRKLVASRRGGYCFELNALMLSALGSFGLECRAALGRVLFGRPEGAEILGRTHQISVVRLGERDWLVDVGFGGLSPREPIPLEMEVERRQVDDAYRLREDPELGIRLEWRSAVIETDWMPLYAFRLDRVYPADLVIANHFTSTFPTSPFRSALRIGRLVNETRFTLSSELTERRGGETRSTSITTRDALIETLDSVFDIELEASDDELDDLLERMRAAPAPRPF